MNIQIESDWHLELHPDGGQAFIETLDPTGVDVLLLAGDIVSGREPFEALRAISNKYAEAAVLYVPGNHEFWRTAPEATWARLLDAQRQLSNLQVLRNQRVVIQGQGFVGGTMWFPYTEPHYGNSYESLMPDFDLIHGFKPWVYDEHADFVKALEGSQEGDVVLTHHTPSPRSIPKRFKNSAINRFFVANMEGRILDHKPRLWVHGHTHDAFDYKLAGARILCNPRGYRREAGLNGYCRKLV